ncbi:MAG: hypothetical protein HOP20_02960 [Sulfuriferula sp.]|nr:hypothetical protein [Sulfuriferula sp.]
MKDFIQHLVNQSKLATPAINHALDDALTHLDHSLAGIAAALEVEYIGPFVGVETLKAHAMVIRAHEWQIHQHTWSMKICSAVAEANYRPEWPAQGASRLRKRLIVQALPAFFAGYTAAVQAANKLDTPAGKRLTAINAQFNHA